MKDITELPNNYIDNFYVELGKKVKKIRMQKGVSQLKLSLAIGHKSLSIVSLAEIFHNKHHFNIEHLVKIAYVLDVDIRELLPDDMDVISSSSSKKET